MITLKETNSAGVSREVVFSDRRECADALRDLFGADALATEAQHIRNRTNDALRAAYKSREVDPIALFRRGDNKSD